MAVLTIHIYALCILVGIVLAVIITSRRLTKRGAEPGVVLDIALWAVPLGIIGARHLPRAHAPRRLLLRGRQRLNPCSRCIWTSGRAATPSSARSSAARSVSASAAASTGIRFWSFADALAPGLLVAQAIGRLGNWFNHELFGLPDRPAVGPRDRVRRTRRSRPACADGTLFHPTFLYEIIWNLAGRRASSCCSSAGSTCAGARRSRSTSSGTALGRSFFESIRVDPSEMFLGIRVERLGVAGPRSCSASSSSSCSAAGTPASSRARTCRAVSGRDPTLR